jgi:hypothetical protein
MNLMALLVETIESPMASRHSSATHPLLCIENNGHGRDHRPASAASKGFLVSSRDLGTLLSIIE